MSTEQSNFMNKLLFLVLPTKQKPQKQAQQASPFEKLYFSFPALEEETESCGNQHHHSKRHHVVKSTNSILC